MLQTGQAKAAAVCDTTSPDAPSAPAARPWDAKAGQDDRIEADLRRRLGKGALRRAFFLTQSVAVIFVVGMCLILLVASQMAAPPSP